MLKVEYNFNKQELAKATVDFMRARPLVKLGEIILKTLCPVMLILYGLKLYYQIATTKDFAYILFVILFIGFSRKITQIIVASNLPNSSNKACYTIDKVKLSQAQTNQNPVSQPWKNLKFIYKNKIGYIVPITGFNNGGKFIYLPKHGFKAKSDIDGFEELLMNCKIKVKKI